MLDTRACTLRLGAVLLGLAAGQVVGDDPNPAPLLKPRKLIYTSSQNVPTRTPRVAVLTSPLLRIVAIQDGPAPPYLKSWQLNDIQHLTPQLGRVAVLLAVAADRVVADDDLPPGGAGGQVRLQLGQVRPPRLLQQTPCVTNGRDQTRSDQ